MNTVHIEQTDDIALVTLNNGITNAIGPELVLDLSQALDFIRKQAKGVILCGGEKFFSIGFDLPALIEFNRDEMSIFFSGFNRLVLKLYTYPLPTLCAMKGHTIAGGAILASACDFRYAGSVNKKTGLNETSLGIPVPYLADMILRHLLSSATANDLLSNGRLLSFAEAKAVGLIDHTSSQENLYREALEQVSKYISVAAPEFTVTKNCRTASIQHKYAMHHLDHNKKFLDCWFSASAQRKLRAAIDYFQQ